jgi:hypothetical protein
MSLPTCTITATVYGMDGEPARGGQVTILNVELENTLIVQGQPQKIQADSDGNISLVLPRGATVTLATNINNGSNAPRPIIQPRTVKFVVPDSESADLAAIVGGKG